MSERNDEEKEIADGIQAAHDREKEYSRKEALKEKLGDKVTKDRLEKEVELKDGPND